jgi:hypothetical protein
MERINNGEVLSIGCPECNVEIDESRDVCDARLVLD